MDKLDWRGWLLGGAGWFWLVFGLGLAGLMAQTGLLQIWSQSEEYGHGLMVFAVLAYLVGVRWQRYRPETSGGAVFSLGLAAGGLVAVVVGEASGISLVGYYGIWLFGLAAVFAVGGWGFFRRLLVPLLIVPLLFPLPNPLGPMLTAELQLISSKLGVWFIRLLGGSVFLEGNVLDMGGGTQLLVAEACAGLRYLFPLMSLGAIAGLLMHAPLWMRWVVFLATVPITVFMNSFRIAVTGILVSKWGNAHTEGFLHFFEGWVVFIFAVAILVGVIWLLVRLLPGRRSMLDVLAWRVEERDALSAAAARHSSPLALRGIVALLFLAVGGAYLMSSRGEFVPDRRPLSQFPELIGDWSARVDRLPAGVEGVAGASEYFYGDYSSAAGGVVNAYVAFYENQRHGQIPHSPKVCIPGGGWTIENESTVTLAVKDGAPIVVNRLVTGLGGRKVVSYYWLKQGARAHRKEFLARIDLVRTSLLQNRTDGALVRLVTELGSGEDLQAADARLQRFAAEFAAILPGYVPD